MSYVIRIGKADLGDYHFLTGAVHDDRHLWSRDPRQAARYPSREAAAYEASTVKRWNESDSAAIVWLDDAP
jgi:hypothetical protein